MPKTAGKVSPSTAHAVRARVLEGKPRLWKHSDFKDLPAGAVAATLSRLSRGGQLQRVGKGVYYRPVRTSLGTSIASPSSIAAASLRMSVHPAGLSAANVLGLTTQNPGRPEYATSAFGPPKALKHAVVHVRRPTQRAALPPEDGAMLEVLRDRAQSSDLSPEETVQRLEALLADSDRYRRLVQAAAYEPPRVRAMLGALGQEIGAPEELLNELRASLNPLSRFDFGRLRSASHAVEWQAK